MATNAIDLTKIRRLPKRSRVANGPSMDHTPKKAKPDLSAMKEEHIDDGLTTLLSPQLITSGTKRVLLPPECAKGSPNYEQARKNIAKTEVAKLKALGLVHRRVLVRPDGMIIDWDSTKPVWNDTLTPNRPEGSHPVSQKVHEATPLSSPTRRDDFTNMPTPITNLKMRHKLSASVTQGTTARDPILLDDEDPDEDMPLRLVKSRASRCSTRQDTPAGSDIQPNAEAAASASLPSPPPSHSAPSTSPPITSRRNSPLKMPTNIILPKSPPSWESNDCVTEAMAHAFFKRFWGVFTGERRSLVNAYSNQIVFSSQFHNPLGAGSTSTSMSRKNSENPVLAPISQMLSRSEVVGFLNSWGKQHICRPIRADSEQTGFTFVYLPPLRMAMTTAMVILHDPKRQNTLTCEQVFMLRRKDDDEIDRATPDTWPVLAVCHQVILRDASVSQAFARKIFG